VVSKHGVRVNLAWTNNASNAAGIVVQRSTDSVSWTTWATLSGTASSYTDRSVSKGQTYYYRVYAYNSLGDSAYSNVAQVVTSAVGTKAGVGNASGWAGQPNVEAGGGDTPALGGVTLPAAPEGGLAVGTVLDPRSAVVGNLLLTPGQGASAGSFGSAAGQDPSRAAVPFGDQAGVLGVATAWQREKVTDHVFASSGATSHDSSSDALAALTAALVVMLGRGV